MQESIHKYFRIGVIQWMSHPPADRDVLTSIRQIACDDYFDAIEIGRFNSDESREKAKKMLAAAHMTVCYGGQTRILGGPNPNSLDENERLAAEATLREAVDEANYLGAKAVAFLSGKWQEETREQAYAQLMKTTRAVCDYAAKRGMTINLEVFDYDMDKAALIGPAPLAARFAADVRTTCSNFGLLVDLSHIPITHETARFAVQTMRPYITHFHIGNAVTVEGAPDSGDRHPRFGFPNSANDVDTLTDFLRVLRGEGFFRENDPMVLSFEVTPYGDEDPDVVLASSKRALNRAWAMA